VPGFRVHITGSSIVGVAYGAAAWYVGDMHPVTCALGGGLCAVSGMLPDLDSGPGIPLKESVAFAAAVVPMMMIHRFQQLGHWRRSSSPARPSTSPSGSGSRGC
jgi:hypothetical protein